MKLTPGDTLPLKLGRRTTLRPEEMKPAIVGIDYSSEVVWTSALDDNAVQRSDLKHESAPKLGGIPTKTSVKKSIVDMIDTMYKTAAEACGIPPRADRMNVTRAEADRATTNFINLPLDEQRNMLGDNPKRHREIGDRYEYRSKCGCDECAVVRTMVNRERRGDFGKTTRGVPALQSFQAAALAKLQAAAPRVTVDYGRSGGDESVAVKRWVDARGDIHVKAVPIEEMETFEARVGLRSFQADPYFDSVQLLLHGASDDAPAKIMRVAKPTCPGCGVAEGSKHFLSCYVVRPSLLAQDDFV